MFGLLLGAALWKQPPLTGWDDFGGLPAEPKLPTPTGGGTETDSWRTNSPVAV